MMTNLFRERNTKMVDDRMDTRKENTSPNWTNLSPGKRNQRRVMRMAWIIPIPTRARKKETWMAVLQNYK